MSMLSALAWILLAQDKAGNQIGAVEQSLRIPRVEPANKPGLQITTPEVPAPNQQDENSRVRVERFKFTGYTVMSSGALQSIVRPYEGRELSIREIKDVANLVTRAYRDEGYMLAWAYIPPQEVKDGVVEIAIVEGRVDKVVVGGNKYYRSDFISRHLGPLEGQPVLSVDSLERSLLLLNDYPNLQARATLRPGAAPGTTDVYIEVEDNYPIKASFDYDNFGSEAVSEHRLGATVDVLDLWKMGHELEVRGVVGAEVENLKYGKIEYRMPIGTSGLRVSASFGYMNYQATGGILSVIEPNGEGPIYSLGASYPFIKTRTTVLTVEVGFSGRDIEQRIGGFTQSFDHIRAVYVGSSLDLSDQWAGRTVITVQVREGLGSFLDGTQTTDLPSRAGASNEFMKATGQLLRIQRVLSGLYLVAKISGQWTNDALLASEQFGLGGGDTVRGYPSFDYAGDWGFAATGELRLIPPGLADLKDPFSKGDRKIGDALQLAVFLDYGEAGLNKPGPGERDLRIFEGAGCGFRVNYPSVSIRFDIAWPLAQVRPSTGDDMMYYVQVIATY